MQKNILEYLEKSAKNFPHKTAIRSTSSSITFLELQSSAKAVAAKLQSLDIKSQTAVGVFLPKGIHAITAFLGILYSGDFYVPIDIKNPTSRIKAIIDNINIKYIITDKQNIHSLSGLDVNLIPYDDITLGDAINFNDKNFKESIDTDIMHILNTSGSTGIPKGVTIPHRSIIDYVDWIVGEYGLDESIIIANQSPLVFDISTSDIYLTLATGGELALVDEQLFMFPPKLLEFLQDIRANFIFWVPSILSNIAKFDLLKDYKLNIKYIFSGGELMPTKHFTYWQKHLPNAVCVNTGGATEVGVVCTHYRLDRNFSDDEPLPIGYPCKNTEILILDDENNLIKDKNIVGEFCIKGSSLALGYYNDPQKTSLSFVQNPLNKVYPERIYRTGDLAYYNYNGELVYKGRKDFQIKHMGYRIELGEIDTAILAVEGIDNACTVYDNEEKRITLVYESFKELTKKEILLAVANKLPKYMLPSKFVKLDAMPLNTNGKIDRKKIQILLEDKK